MLPPALPTAMQNEALVHESPASFSWLGDEAGAGGTRSREGGDR
jgi:hypothetical protein